ncbi:M16 family metallopeptidase [Vibrio nigripulchritudo]|uniref:M16 family metallopeptidase n=1 Tax=Vibrio nigripulchritudo TaxID=28173 RepID=UPI000570C217|nr:insulinase family protein [Vibrio nigripulchritudo]
MFTHTFKPAALLLFASCSFVAYSAQKNDALWYTPTDIPADDRFQVSQLDNGMRVIMVDNDLPKQSMSIQMYVDAGSHQDPQSYPGLAHFLEHMAFNGSTHVAEGAMVPMLEKHGLAFGADTNASTTLTYTTYELDLPNATPEAVDTALFLLRETASELTLAPSAIERERGVIQAERRLRGTKAQQRYIARIQYLMGKSNVYERLPIGTASSIDRIDQKALKTFYKRYYRPEHTTLIVSGAVQEREMMKNIRKHFSDWRSDAPMQAIDDPAITYSLPKQAEAYANIDPENRHVGIGLNFISPREQVPYGKAQHLDYLRELIAVKALNHRLSYLVEHNNADGKLRSPEATVGGHSGVVRIRDVSVITDEGEWKLGLQTLYRVLKQATTYGFSEREIQRQIDTAEHNLKVDEEQSNSSRNVTLSNRVVNALDDEFPLVSEQTDLEIFEEMKSHLTVESINRVFREHWMDSAVRIYLDDRSASSDIDQQLLDSYHTLQKEKVEPYQAPEKYTFAYADFGPASKVTELKPTTHGAIQRYQFENGVMLNFKETDLEKNAVYLTINFGHGTMGLQKHNAPLTTIFAPAVVLSGAEKNSNNSLKELFAGRSFNLSLSTNHNAFLSEAVLESEDVLDQLRIMAAILSDNGYRADGWESGVRYYIDLLASYENDPERVLKMHSPFLLHGGDFRWRFFSLEQVRSLSMKDVKTVLEHAIHEGPIEVSLVGDITREQAIQYVGRTFGALKIHAKRPSKPYSHSFPPFKTESVTLYHTGEADKAVVSEFWKVPDGSNPVRNAQYRVLQGVLQHRVTETIRETMGVAYSPYVDLSLSNWYKGYGYINIHSNTAAKHVEGIKKVYQDIWQSLQNSVISEEELEQVRAPILESFAQKPQYNQYWSNVASVAQSLPVFVESESLYADALKAVTAEDIQQLAQSMNVKESLSVQVLPKP